MRNNKVILKDGKISVYTDYPSRLYFETPEMNDEEISQLYDQLRVYYGDAW